MITLHFLRVFVLVYAAMANLQPGVPHAEIAFITTAAIIDDPLFEDDRLNVANVVGAEFEESSFRISAIGDSGRSCGALQVFGGCNLSQIESIEHGIEQMRVSFAMNHDCLWCGFLAGPHGVESARVRRMSRHRERLVACVLRDMTGPDLTAALSVRP